jgi:hypothetical protein
VGRLKRRTSMGTKIVVPAFVVSLLLASTSARAADLGPTPTPVLAGYHIATPYYGYPHHVRKFVPRYFDRETIIIDRPVVVERPVVIERPVEIIEQPILVDPYPTYDEPDDGDDIYTIEEPY